MFEKKSLILDLINPDVGEEGVEGDTPLEEGQGKRHGWSSRCKKRRVEDAGGPDLNALVSHSAEMAASVKKQTDLSEPASLSQTLKNLKEASTDPEVIESVHARLRQALLAGPLPSARSSSVVPVRPGRSLQARLRESVGGGNCGFGESPGSAGGGGVRR